MAGKIILQANDGKTLSLTAPEGMSSNTTDVVATLNSPVFTGTPMVPTPTTSTQVANKGYIDTEISRKLNALAPHSGLLLDRKDFYFNTTASYLCKVSVQDEYIKVGDKVVETYGEELVTNGDFSNGTTGWSYDRVQNLVVVDGVVNIENNTSVSGNGYIKQYFISDKPLEIKINVADIGNGGHIRHYDYNNVLTYYELKQGMNIINPTKIGIQMIMLEVSGAYDAGRYFKVDNISVREVKTIDLNTTNDRTGFYGSASSSFVPEVLVQDQAVNGLTVTSGVKKGDYVITKAEVLGNGGFDSDSIWSKSGGATISGGVGNLTGSSYTDDPYLRQDNIFIKQGTKYTITFDIVSLSNCNLWLHTNSGTISSYNTTGTKTVEWTATEYNGIFFQTNVRTPGATCTIDNVKVISHQDTYRAIQDAPSGTSLPNTTYFQTRDYISNQVLTMLKADGTLYSEVLMNDVYAEDIGSDRVFTSNGWSKVCHGLWSKGSVVGSGIGIWQTLNRGAYHPWFNSKGTKSSGDSTHRAWYASTINNVASAFTNVSTHEDFGLGTYQGVTQSVNGIAYDKGLVSYDGSAYVLVRPDAKFYDIIYQDQWIDLRTYATKQNHNLDVLANKAVSAELSGISNEVCVVETYNSGAGLTWYYDGVAPTKFFVVKGSQKFKVGTTIMLSSVSKDFYFTAKVSSINGDEITLNSVSILRGTWTSGGTITTALITKPLPILSSKTKLSTDLIGLP